MPRKAKTVLVEETLTNATDNPKIVDGEVEIEPDVEEGPTQKEIFQNLHAEMTKYGIHSIGQLEVKIAQL